ncbi:endonuclease [Solibacillus isronensis]|uniref:endonuclease n=1 Tax=Solibacillus isronensis TaxID=412383 RepID=UPI0015910F08|nr:endonuclease [Solibacillus isronensis]
MYNRKLKKSLNALLATSLVASVVVPAAPVVTHAETLATDLIISEYIEGSSYNKAIEIYNGTGASVNLSEYTLELHTNGIDTADKSVPMSGVLEHGDVYVVYHKDANPAIKAVGDLENSVVANFNGDDPVVLRKSGVIVDSIGQAGARINNKADVTLVRNSNITRGDTNITDSFDPTSEWTNLGKDNFSNIGSHTMDSGAVTPPDESKVAMVSASHPSSTVSKGTEITLSTATDGAVIYYTTDGSEPSAEKGTQYSKPLVIDQTTTIKAIAIAEGMENSEVTTFTYTVTNEAELPTIAEVRGQATGTTVTVKGKVAANLKNTISIQDETGGIAVRPTGLGVNVGDEVILTGKLADFRGLLQLDGATIVDKTTGGKEPEAKVVAVGDINETLESQLVTVKNTTLTIDSSGSGWVNYKAVDELGNHILIRDETGQLDLLRADGDYESITGIVQQYDKDYQIIPRSSLDIVEDSTILKPAVASPGSGTYVGKQTVILSTPTADAKIYYTVNGYEPTAESTEYSSPIEIIEDTTLKAIVVKDGVLSEVATFDYKITDGLQIHDIQGAGHATSFNNENVEVEGIVTYEFMLNGAYYYTIQTPDELADKNPYTSEAIFLYAGTKAWPVEIGDLVKVTGKVSEYAYDGYSDRQATDLKTTQINVRDDQGGQVELIKRGVLLPETIPLDETNISFTTIDNDQFTKFDPEEDAIDFWESIEGMRVSVGNVKAVSPQEHGDLITVLESEPTNSLHGGVLYEEGKTNPNRIQFRLEPNGAARNFEVATGDKFAGPITGIVGYSYQNYKIYAELEEMKDKHKKGSATPEKTTIEKDDKKLTMASYNLENFSNNEKETSDAKVGRLVRAFVDDMQSPDIIGVTEVQDNNGSSAGNSNADESYKRLITAIEAAGGPEYKYLNIDPVNNEDGGAPNANIRVGFLYNPERVGLPEDIKAGDATSAVGYENGKLTLNPGRIDPTNSAFNSSRKPLAAQFTFNGEDVIAIVNHWNSKSGDTPLFGSIQPPVYESEVQRKKIAKIVYDFVADIKSKNPNANIVSVGDFNDYQFADALKIHEGQLMTNMINKVEEKDRYTYLYQGNSQVLDHILVSNNLAKNTEIDILHINADFTDMAGRASDHDPVMVQIDLHASGEVQEPIKAEKVYTFTGFKTKKLVIIKPSVEMHLDGNSQINEGITVNSNFSEFHGDGFKTTVITVKPQDAGAIVDLKGTELKKLVIDGTNVSEIRGAENIQEIEYINGAKAENIKITNGKGDPITGPSFPSENRAPLIIKSFENKTVNVVEEIKLSLSEHFSDPDGDKLSFSATKGMVDGDVLTLNLQAGSHIVGVTATDGKESVTAQFTLNVKEIEGNDYYKTAYGKEGQALKQALHEIIDDQKILSYAKAWEALRETDEDPNNPNNVLLFYSAKSISKTSNGGNTGNWNREHVWAKSHGNFGTSNGPGTDIHHLRPTDVQVNSSRGNLDFDEGGSAVTGCSGCFKDSDSFEPPNEVKGDVARILFYMATRYEKGDRVDLELNEKVNNGSNPYHGKLSILLKWHKQDPVSEFEKKRNEKIFEWQGNRNPFIDHPEWVELIWAE